MDQESTKRFCHEIDQTSTKLTTLNNRAKGDFERYLVQPINFIILALDALATTVDKNPHRIRNFEKPNDCIDTLGMISRAFVSLIHSCTETALDDLIAQKNYDLKSSILAELEKDIQKAACACGNNKVAIKKLINDAKSSFTPNFKDKIILVTEHLQKKQKKNWRSYFDCFTILRHKCSHADCKVNENQKRLLIESDFGHFLDNNNVITLNVADYVQIYSNLLEFIREISE